MANGFNQFAKKRTTKPDGTVSEEFFNPADFLTGGFAGPPTLEQAGVGSTGPSPLAGAPQFTVPQSPQSPQATGGNGGFLNNLIQGLVSAGNTVAQPEIFGQLGQLAQAIAPGTVGANLGRVGERSAKSRILAEEQQGQQNQMLQLIQQLLGGGSAGNPSSGLSSARAGLLGPELVGQLGEQRFRDTQAALQTALKTAELGLQETPEQRRDRELAVVEARKEPGRAITLLSEDEQGNPLPEGEKTAFTVNTATGEKIPIGRVSDTKIKKIPTAFKSTGDRSKFANQLRNDTIKSKNVAEFNTVRSQVNKAKSIIGQAKDAITRGVSQEALILIFEKLLDPTSVVRESEFMRVAAGESALERLDTLVKRASEGGFVSDNTINSIENLLDVIASSGQKFANQEIDARRAIGLSAGLTDDVLPKRFDDFDENVQEAPAQQPVLEKTSETSPSFKVLSREQASQFIENLGIEDINTTGTP